MSRPRKEKTEVIRIREIDAQRLRQLQLKTGLPSIADAMTLLVQQYNTACREGKDQLIARKYTLEAVDLEVFILSECDQRFVGWKGSEVTEIEPGRYRIKSKSGSDVIVENGMEVSAVLRSA